MLEIKILEIKTSLMFLCLVSGQVAFAAEAPNQNITTCFDPNTKAPYFTNIQSSLPTDCQNTKIIQPYEFKKSAQDTGLRPAEKAQLQELNTQEQIQKQADLNRYQNVDEKVGLGVYGSWQDYRQAQCFAYQERVAEAQADRKNDVRLNRQIQRDLKQIEYYCR
jgi:hypothetical protein